MLASLLDDELSSSESFVWICLLNDDEIETESLDWFGGWDWVCMAFSGLRLNRFQDFGLFEG